MLRTSLRALWILGAIGCGTSAVPGSDGGGGDGGPIVPGRDGGRGRRDSGPLPDGGPPPEPTSALRILHPRAVGTTPEQGTPVIQATHRIYWAYPGIEYNIRAAVVGGAYPYSYELQGAPAGMTIEPNGEIRWPDPSASSGEIVLRVTDALGTTVSESWSIAVDASRFLFVDSVRGSESGNGTIDNPFLRVSDYSGDASYAGRIAYFRAGTHDVLDIDRGSLGTPWERVHFRTDYHPVAWLAYPGENAIVDFGFEAGAEAGPLIRLSGDSIYLDGFETIRSHYIAWQIEPASHYAVFRRMRMHQHGPGIDGSNASLIMTMTGLENPSHFMAIQDNEIYDTQVTSGLKIYSTVSMVIENNVFHDGDTPIELKADIRNFTVQNNLFYSVIGTALGGNMHNETTNGEIRFNLIADATFFALRLNQDGMAGPIRVYRNTIVGQVMLSMVGPGDGPFTFEDNVIVDSSELGSCIPGSPILCDGLEDASRIVLAPPPDDDLVCTPGDGCVDDEGYLIGSHRSMYLGVKGAEIP